MMSAPKILVIPGSLRSASYNIRLAAVATKELTLAESIHVLGAQFQLWSEWLPHPRHVEYMTYPRGCAMAEVYWSPAEGRSYDEFEPRLLDLMERLKVIDVNYRPSLVEPEPVGEWKLDKGQSEKTFEWALPAGKAGRHVLAFCTPHNDRPFALKAVRIVAGATTVAEVDALEPIDPHRRGCEVAFDLPALGTGAKLVATVENKDGKEIDGTAFLFAEPAG